MKLLKFAVLLLIPVLLVGCNKPAPKTESVPTTEIVTQPVTTEEEYIPSLTEQAKETGVSVETPYITFYYPQQWTELKSAEVTQEGNNCRVTFVTTVGDRELELFSMVIGPDEAEGYLLGTLDGANVYSVMNDQNPEEWSEEDYIDLCRQQEYINELILQLHEHAAFKRT